MATAHYLVRVMHAMLRTGEAWREEETCIAAAMSRRGAIAPGFEMA